jgi:ABC-2 type transport system permease protein
MVAPIWPAYHLDQLILRTAGILTTAASVHLAVLLGVTVLFGWLALRRLERVS